MREMSVTEQRYKAVLAVIGDGRTVSEVATDWGVSRRTMHSWLARYEAEGLQGLNNRSQSSFPATDTSSEVVLPTRSTAIRRSTVKQVSRWLQSRASFAYWVSDGQCIW